jgi:diguanylate cyclase (GGDEF)-like protein
MTTFLLVDKDTNSTFTEIRNFQIRLLKIIVGIGLLGVLVIWFRNMQILNDVNLFDRIAYPSLITLLSSSLLILCFWRQGYPVAALISVGGFAAYYIFYLQTIIGGNQSAQDINIITETTQWFPLIYITGFIFLKKHQAVIISISIYSSLLVAIVPKFLFGINTADNSHLFPVLSQMICSHPIYIAALLWIILIQNYLTQAITQINSMKTIVNLDYLTGITNRRGINEILQQRFVQTKNINKKFAVILVDIDHFKKINDTYGHDVGDQVLIGISNLLSQNISIESSIGRWGGEEFMIVLNEATVESATNLAQKLCTYISKQSYPPVERVTASFGIALSQPSDTIKSLTKRSDVALYQAKNKGRNRVEFASFNASSM